jgi:hypothetical protein
MGAELANLISPFQRVEMKKETNVDARLTGKTARRPECFIVQHSKTKEMHF